MGFSFVAQQKGDFSLKKTDSTLVYNYQKTSSYALNNALTVVLADTKMCRLVWGLTKYISNKEGFNAIH